MLIKEPLTKFLGIKVSGLDITKPLSPQIQNELRNLLHEHQLILINQPTATEADLCSI